MSVTFSTGFHTIKPGLRVSGDEISVVFVNTYDTGIYAGKKYINIDLTNEPDLVFVEAGVSGPLETVPDVDALYNQLKDAGMTEAFEGFLVDPSDLSIISIDAAKQISFDFAGHSPYIFSRNPDANATEQTKVAHQTWSLPQADFAGAVTLFTSVESPEEIEFQSIEDRFALEQNQLDALIASGMWLFATQADFPPASDNHGRVVHSHADGAIFFAHAGTWNQVANEADLQTAIASLANEASTREAADNALDARLDVLEADPTTAAAVAAGDAATLSSANTYTDGKIADVVGSAPGILDTLGEIADSINDDNNVYTTLVSQIDAVQSNVDSNATVSNAADAALSGRLDTLEADPITNAEVVAIADAVNADRVSGDVNLQNQIDTLETESATQAGLDAEITARTTADSALDGRVTTLEGNAAITDPTTATAVAAVQSDVDQNEADSDAADAALSGRLDVLEADPTTQALLDAETAARIAGDDALRNELFPSPACPYQDIQATVSAGNQSTPQDGKLHYDAANKRLFIPNDLRKTGTPPNDTEIWPYGPGETPPDGSIYIDLVGNVVVQYANISGVVFAQLTDDISDLLDTEIVIRWCSPSADLPYVLPEELDAEITARSEGDLNAMGQSNAYTDGLFNQYFGGASNEVKSDSYAAVIQAGFTPIVDATAGQFKFDATDVASVTAIAINHDSDAGRIDWFEVFPTGSVLRVTRASDSAIFDFVVTQAGVGGPNSRTKNFTVTTTSTGTLAADDSLSISTLAGPDIATGGNLDVAGDVNVNSAVYSYYMWVPGTDPLTGKRGISADTNSTKLWARGMSDPGGEGSHYLSWGFGNLTPNKNSSNEIIGQLGTADFAWKTAYLGDINGTGQTEINGTYIDFGKTASQAGRIEFGANLTKIHNLLRGTSINIGNNIELKPAAAGGRVEITGDLIIDASDFTNAANDTAAAAAGVVVGQVYRNGSDLKVRIS